LIYWFSSFLGSSSPTSACGAIGLLDGTDPLLPSSYGLANGNGNNGSGSPTGGIKEENGGGDGESGGVVKANKGMILRKSVDYIRYSFPRSFLMLLAEPYYFFPRYLQQLVTAQGARNRELEQELKAYRRASGSGSGSSPNLNGYPPPRRSNTVGGGGTRTASHSRSTPSDESREEDSMMLHDSVDGIGVGGGSVIEFGNYGAGGGGDGRGGLPSMPEGDDEDVDYDDSPHLPHHHQQHHQQHPQHHPHHHQQEDMVVDNLGMGMNMEMMGAMNGGTMHFNGMDNNNNNASPEDLRGRPRVARHLDSDGAAAADKNTTGGALKEEDDDDIVNVVGGFGIANGRTAHGM
jgi:hypothetical protein